MRLLLVRQGAPRNTLENRLTGQTDASLSVGDPVKQEQWASAFRENLWMQVCQRIFGVRAPPLN